MSAAFVETEEGFVARSRVVRVIAKDEHDEIEYVGAHGAACYARLVPGLDALVDDATVVPAAPGYRLTRVYFADASGPAMLDVAPIVGWLIDSRTGAVTPIVLPVDGLDPEHPDCGVEGPDYPGVVSHGTRYVTLTLFIEARRDAIREAAARRAESLSRFPKLGNLSVPAGTVPVGGTESRASQSRENAEIECAPLRREPGTDPWPAGKPAPIQGPASRELTGTDMASPKLLESLGESREA